MIHGTRSRVLRLRDPLEDVWSNCADQARRQEDQGGDQSQRSMDRDPYQAEGKQDQPHDRVQKEREQGQRPAKNQEEAKQQEVEHAYPLERNMKPGRELADHFRLPISLA